MSKCFCETIVQQPDIDFQLCQSCLDSQAKRDAETRRRFYEFLRSKGIRRKSQEIEEEYADED